MADYPKVISIQEPLIVRVNKTMLTVGSVAYSAKIKTGIQHCGFYIYSSGIGTPIYSEQLNDTTIRTFSADGDDLYNYIEDLSAEWLDKLQDSFSISSTLTISDMIKALMYQMHYDVTGEKPEEIPEVLEPLLNFESESISDMMKTLSEKLDVVATNIEGITNEIEKTNDSITSEEYGLPKISENIGLISSTMETLDTNMTTSMTALIAKLADGELTLGKQIENSVTEAIAHIDGRLDTIDEDNTEIANRVGNKFWEEEGSINDKIGIRYSSQTTLNRSLTTLLSKLGNDQTTDTIYGMEQLIVQKIDSMNSNVNSISGNVSTIRNSVGDLDAWGGTLQRKLGLFNPDYSGTDSNSIHTIVADINGKI